MMKMMTWAGIALSLLGAVVDFARPESSGTEEAVELALFAKTFLSDAGAKPPEASPATR